MFAGVLLIPLKKLSHLLRVWLRWLERCQCYFGCHLDGNSTSPETLHSGGAVGLDKSSYFLTVFGARWRNSKLRLLRLHFISPLSGEMTGSTSSKNKRKNESGPISRIFWSKHDLAKYSKSGVQRLHGLEKELFWPFYCCLGFSASNGWYRLKLNPSWNLENLSLTKMASNIVCNVWFCYFSVYILLVQNDVFF